MNARLIGNKSTITRWRPREINRSWEPLTVIKINLMYRHTLYAVHYNTLKLGDRTMNKNTKNETNIKNSTLQPGMTPNGSTNTIGSIPVLDTTDQLVKDSSITTPGSIPVVDNPVVG